MKKDEIDRLLTSWEKEINGVNRTQQLKLTLQLKNLLKNDDEPVQKKIILERIMPHLDSDNPIGQRLTACIVTERDFSSMHDLPNGIDYPSQDPDAIDPITKQPRKIWHQWTNDDSDQKKEDGRKAWERFVTGENRMDNAKRQL